MLLRKPWDHGIDLKEDFPPKKGRLIPLSVDEQKEVKAFLDDQLSKGYIRPSRSQQTSPGSCTKHIWYSEHGMYCQFEIILERVMSATHVAVILRTRTSPAYEEEFMKMDYPDARNEYGMS